jgi:hypothetical protein
MEDEEKTEEERVEVIDFKKRAIRHCSAREKGGMDERKLVRNRGRRISRG